MNRRDFIASAAVVGATPWIHSGKAYAGLTPRHGIRVAVVGLRGRGRDHLRAFGAAVVAVCDVDRKVLETTRDALGQQGIRVDTFVDYRRLLEREDIDAVSVATPNHTHALISVAAIAAGKAVYCEKPVSHNVSEGRSIVEAAQRHNAVVQTGTQARSSECLRQAVDWVRSGALGSVQYAHVTCYRARTSIGLRTDPLPIPDHIHYDLWCGPAEMRELYRSQLHYDWHWDFNTGCGDLGNQGVHQLDIARWFLGEAGLPNRVQSFGGRFGYRDAGNTPNTMVSRFDYPDAPIICEVRGLPVSASRHESWQHSMGRYRGSTVGVLVQCEKGHVFASSTYEEVVAYDREGEVVKRWTGAGDHYGNWLDAIAATDPAKLTAPIEDGHVSSALCHLGNVSYRVGESATPEAVADSVLADDLLSPTVDRMIDHLRANGVELRSTPLVQGKSLQINPAAETIAADDLAERMLYRACREPFVVR